MNKACKNLVVVGVGEYVMPDKLELMTQDELLELILCTGRARQIAIFLAGLAVGISGTSILFIVLGTIHG